MLPLPFYGLRVIELAPGAAGATAAGILAAMGAEVIRVAPPGARDADPARDRDKLACSLDVASDAGRDLVRRLVASADAVIDGTGFAYEDLAAGRPGLVVVAASAASAYGAANAGVAAASALIAALFQRRATGDGQRIAVDERAVFASFAGAAPAAGLESPAMAPYGAYPAAGDSSVAIAVRSDAEFAALCKVIGRLELADDARFADLVARRHNRAELDAILAAWTRTHSAGAITVALAAAGVAASPVQTLASLREDRHLRARGFFEPVATQDGVTEVAALPYRFARTPVHVRLPAPRPGEHDAYVFKELLGLSEDEIASLRAAGVVGPAP